MNNDQKTKPQFSSSWSFTNRLDNVFKDAHAIVILTEWEEYSNIDWSNISRIMKKPGWVFDSRSVVKKQKVLEANLKLWRIGDGT
jgi:UDPglucose 6-dehydrogenase